MVFHLGALGRQQKRDQLIAPKFKLSQVLSSTRWHTVLVIQAVYLLFTTQRLPKINANYHTLTTATYLGTPDSAGLVMVVWSL